MQCNYITNEGDPCQANAMKQSDFCFTHNPEAKDRHLEAASKGGSVSRDLGDVVLPSIQISHPSHVVSLLEDTINKVRVTRKDGTIDIRVANCIGYLAGQLLKAIELSDIRTRLEIVERIIFERKSITKE